MPILFAAALLGLLAWQLLPPGEPAIESDIEPTAPRDGSKSSSEALPRQAAISAPFKARDERVERPNTNRPAPRMEESVVMVSAETNSLRQLIPDWLLKQGAVRSDRIKVGDGWADRLRSRYAWPDDGGSVEVEVSDLGVGATEEQFKSLGFDFELEEEETEDGIRTIDDRKEYVANLEYNREDGEGHVQYLVAGRFLMEVQLEGLPLESFQILENRHSLIGRLVQYAAK